MICVESLLFPRALERGAREAQGMALHDDHDCAGTCARDLYAFHIGAVISAVLNGSRNTGSLILLGGRRYSKTRMHLHYAQLAHAVSNAERVMRSINHEAGAVCLP